MEFSEKKSTATGKVVFMRSNIKEPPYCPCCGDPKVPHAHIYGEHISLDDHPDSIFPGLKVENVHDFIHEALHRMPNIENKRVRVTLEIIGESK